MPGKMGPVRILQTIIMLAMLSESHGQIALEGATGVTFTRFYGPQALSSDFKTSWSQTFTVSKGLTGRNALSGSIAYIENGDVLTNDIYKSALLIRYLQFSGVFQRSFGAKRLSASMMTGVGINTKIQSFSTFQDGNSFVRNNLGYIRDFDVAIIFGLRGSYRISKRWAGFAGVQLQIGLLDVSGKEDITIRNIAIINQVGVRFLLVKG
jgi:hypothetical protein